MSQKIIIDGSRESHTQIALLSENSLEDFEYESISRKNLNGKISLGKGSRSEASLQAAFVEFGSEKNGFLAFGEIHPNYFQIPVADREALIESEAEVEDEYHSNHADNKHETENGNEINELESNYLNDNNEKIDGDENFVEEKQKQSQRKLSAALKRKLYRSYKIQEVIKTGQLILVQIVKEERGNKGAALTSYISLAGKYSVLMPNSTKTKGISRKISLNDDRSKLKKIIEDLKIPQEMGLIIRTAGLNKTKNEIKKDYVTLNKLWAQIVNETKKAIAPALIYEEGNLLRRVVRDLYTKEMKEILVEGKEAYQETKKYMSQILPSCAKFVKHYKNKEPIFSKYNVEKEIVKMFDTEVKLKSGGYLVINPTEALVAIDVNSGGATKERNIEKTALKTNLEATEEIAKQIKIRDLSGLIVVDFIDMYEMRNNRQVERKMKELIKNDRARTQIARISQFGLLEMSRQRLRQSFIEWKTELSHDSIALKFIYQLREKLNNDKCSNIAVKTNTYICDYLKDSYQEEISNLSKKHKVTISLERDDSLLSSKIEFECINKEKKQKSFKKENKVKKRAAPKTKTIKDEKKTITKKKSKSKINKVTPIKEIKNKKSGWWQK